MKRFLAVLVTSACATVLVGCGQQAERAESSSKATPAAGCDAARVGGTPVAKVDLDGDGTPEQVSLTPADAPGCASSLVAEVGGKDVAARLGETAAAGERAYTAVTVPGRTGQLLVVRTSHPRGGSQDALFAYDDGTLGAVTGADGKPLQLPFVATDTSPATEYVAVSCTKNGFVVQEAVPHQPAGVAAAFDVMETAYTLDGLTATAGTATKVGDNVLTAKLPTSYPALSRNSSFSSGCS